LKGTSAGVGLTTENTCGNEGTFRMIKLVWRRLTAGCVVLLAGPAVPSRVGNVVGCKSAMVDALAATLDK